MRLRRLLPAGLLIFAACGSDAALPSAGPIHYQMAEIILDPPTPLPTSTTTTTTTTTIPSHLECPEWYATAQEAGLSDEDLDRWDYIMWRESRCQPDAHNPTDPNSGSYGLTQVNGFWCRPSRYFPQGWLQTHGILERCTDLYDPAINLVAARAIYEYSQDRNRCGWLPWTTRQTRWCR